MDSDVFVMRVAPLLSVDNLAALRCINSRWKLIVDDSLNSSLKSIITPLVIKLFNLLKLIRNKHENEGERLRGIEISCDAQNYKFELKLHSCNKCLNFSSPCPTDDRNVNIILDLGGKSPVTTLKQGTSSLKLFLNLYSIASAIASIALDRKQVEVADSSKYTLSVYSQTFDSELKSQYLSLYRQYVTPRKTTSQVPERLSIAAPRTAPLENKMLSLSSLLKKYYLFLCERSVSHEDKYQVINQVSYNKIKKELLLNFLTLCFKDEDWNCFWKAVEDLKTTDRVFEKYLLKFKKYRELANQSLSESELEEIYIFFKNAVNNELEKDFLWLVTFLNNELKKVILDNLRKSFSKRPLDMNIVKFFFILNEPENYEMFSNVFYGHWENWLIKPFLIKVETVFNDPFIEIKFLEYVCLNSVKLVNTNSQNNALCHILGDIRNNQRYSLDEKVLLFMSVYKSLSKVCSNYAYVLDLSEKVPELLECINDSKHCSLDEKNSFFLYVYENLAFTSLLQGIRWLSRIPNLQCRLPKLLGLAVSFFRFINWIFY